MLVQMDLDLPGLEETLAAILPLGIQPLRLHWSGRALRLDAKAPFLGAVTLTADVHLQPGSMVLSRFELEGAGLAKAMALQKLREAVSGLDRRWKGLRAYGEPEGDRLHLAWT
ncbi:MAG: hypothetical protein EYC70_16710 [Planctomycetota bacterium]|nr:MAG: hypothetical protein EYC70_16710 [Planctomycetota bacterium]